MAISMDKNERLALVRVYNAVEGILNGRGFNPDELAFILGLPPTAEQAGKLLFSAAREMRWRNFRDNIFLYGFVYLSTYCRNDCSFCNYRKSNRELSRYRKEPSEILETALYLDESGVDLIDFTLGEDKYYLSGKGFDSLLKIAERLDGGGKKISMLSPGVLDSRRLQEAAASGFCWYALYQETHNQTLFCQLRPGQDYKDRDQAKLNARRAGMLVEDGVLVGVGATPLDLAFSIMTMSENKNQQVRAMAYAPVPGGLPADPHVDRSWQELLMIACMRLAIPGALIPASLDIDGLAGLERRLLAGANVVTSIVPPSKGLSGVASMILDIENNNRSVEKVNEILGTLGLKRPPKDKFQFFVWSKLVANATHLPNSWDKLFKNEGKDFCRADKRIKERDLSSHGNMATDKLADSYGELGPSLIDSAPSSAGERKVKNYWQEKSLIEDLFIDP